VEKKTVEVEPDAQSVVRVLLKQNELPDGLNHLTVLPDFAIARVGEEGYHVMPNGELGTFREQNGERTAQNFMPMPVFGMKNPRGTFVAIVTGMPNSFTLVTQAKEGVYTIFPRFQLRSDPPSEDIAIAYHLLSGDQADYSGMAKVYRNHQLSRKACIPLKERIKTSPELAYAMRSLAIRVRNGWKPMPTTVTNQTYATGPPMKVAVTFDRVGEILDEFKRQGIESAEICLVGWNRMGHDGRFPEIFPVEEQLDGPPCPAQSRGGPRDPAEVVREKSHHLHLDVHLDARGHAAQREGIEALRAGEGGVDDLVRDDARAPAFRKRPHALSWGHSLSTHRRSLLKLSLKAVGVRRKVLRNQSPRCLGSQKPHSAAISLTVF